MFKKKDSLLLELLDDKIYIKCNLTGKNDPEKVSTMINGLLLRQFLPNIIDAILLEGKKNNCLGYAREVCDQIISTQEKIELKPVVTRPRNPVIRPRDVFKAYQE